MSDQRRERKKERINALTKQLVTQYFLVTLLFIAAVIGFIWFAWRFCNNFIWQPDDPLYQVLRPIKDHILLAGGLICFLGYVLITYYFLSRPLYYLDEIITESLRLAHPETEPLRLPPALRNVEDEMNLARENALRNAQLAKEAEQRKNDLIVYLAHDLKTPLTSVIGYLTLLHDEPEISPGLRARYSGIALDKALRLEDLINDFFDITRFNLTTLTIEKRELNLSRMLEQITSEFEPVLAEKELRWNLQIAPEVRISGDADKLERVFDNLIRNAINYSYPGTEIRLKMLLPEAGRQAELVMENRGKTIPPERLSHIFEQFFRVDAARSSATGGAGLGLAIAKEIVELHGGTIMAESADERIRFVLRLPVEECAEGLQKK